MLLPVPGRGSVFFCRAQHRGAGPYHTATATALTNSKKNMTLVQTCQSRDTFGRLRARSPVEQTFVAAAAALMEENHKTNSRYNSNATSHKSQVTC